MKILMIRVGLKNNNKKNRNLQPKLPSKKYLRILKSFGGSIAQSSPPSIFLFPNHKMFISRSVQRLSQKMIQVTVP